MATPLAVRAVRYRHTITMTNVHSIAGQTTGDLLAKALPRLDGD